MMRHARLSTGTRRHVLVALCLVHLALLAACAARTPPPLPATPRYGEFVYPALPDPLKRTAGAERVDFGWRFLQSDDLRNADREFAAAIRRSPGLYPAEAGAGYVDLARRQFEDALAHFNAALVHAPAYAPALVGRGQALLGLKRDQEALAAFEAAIRADPSLADVRRRVDVLKFRNAQEVVEAARAAAQAGRLEDARAAYRRALENSPDSPFLHRELGIVERRRGDSQAALQELQKAVELDPTDAVAWTAIGELLEQRLDFAAAVDAYRKAAAVEPSDAMTARIEAAAEKARLAKLPAEFHAIPDSQQITRGELAALIGIKAERLLARAAQQQVVLTDVRSHWAAPWIRQVAQAGIMQPFPNHTFAPGAPVRRGDLAAAASRLVMLIAGDERREAWTTARPRIADMNPAHLSYPAVAVAVASGVMPLLEDERFGVTRAVTGAEAVDVLDRVLAIAGGGR